MSLRETHPNMEFFLVRIQEITTRKKSVFGHFSRSVYYKKLKKLKNRKIELRKMKKQSEGLKTDDENDSWTDFETEVSFSQELAKNLNKFILLRVFRDLKFCKK